jgi:hypothetical protein
MFNWLRYWIHADGKIDKLNVNRDHYDFVDRNPEKFGLPPGRMPDMKTDYKNILKDHFRVGYIRELNKLYLETYRRDDKTYSILKRYIPSAIPRHGVEVYWSQVADPHLEYLTTTADKFFNAQNVAQLLQTDMPEYHKTITQFRETSKTSIRNILLERYLVGEFTFGFEYEAFINKVSLGYSKDFPSEAVPYSLMQFFGKYFTGGKIEKDTSITAPKPVNNYITFEYKSPIILATIANFEKLIKLLEDSIHFGIETNDSCGFHIHVGFPGTKGEYNLEALWSICQISLDDESLKMISALEDIKFYSKDYASLKDMSRLGSYIRRKMWASVQEVLFEKKHVLLRAHPQGTVEWRGPRNFLGSKDTPSHNRHIIESFVRLLYRYIIKLAQVQSLPTLDKIITKDEFAELMGVKRGVQTFDKSMKGDLIKEILKRENWWIKNCSFENAVMRYDPFSSLRWISGKWISGTWMGSDEYSPKGQLSLGY